MPSTMQGLTLKWLTTNVPVATVSSQGVVFAKAEGTTEIIVTALEDNALRDTCTITVVERQPGYRYYQFAIEEISSGSAIQLSEIDLIDEDGNIIKDPCVLGKELKSYLDLRPRVPYGIELEGINTINCLKEA